MVYTKTIINDIFAKKKIRGENEVNQTRERLIYYNEFACAFFCCKYIFTFIMLSLNSLTKKKYLCI